MEEEQKELTFANTTAGQIGKDYYNKYRDQRDDINNALDPKVKEGIRAGRDTAKKMYGQTLSDTGGQIQDIVRRRTELIQGDDPNNQFARQQRSQNLAMARSAKGTSLTAGEQSQINRNTQNQLYANYQNNLTDYQAMVSKIAGGQQASELGYAGLQVAGQQPAQASGGSRGLSVICTVLYRDGKLSDAVYKADSMFGEYLMSEAPHIVRGYHAWAIPLTNLMKKNKLVYKLVSLVAIPWAKYIYATTIENKPKPLIGALAFHIGMPLCGLIGRLYGRRIEKNA